MSALGEAARRVARGDGAAFRVLVEATHLRLFRLAARMTGSEADAHDALQDAYAQAFRALSRGGWRERTPIERWLYRIALNASLDLVKARRRRLAREESALPASIEPAQEVQLEVARLQRLVRELPEPQRTAVLLKEVEGLSAAEIADLLGCSEGAVEQRLVRARATLRERWNDE